MIISGVGGQGVMTMTKIISKIFLSLGYDVKSAELHGLSQRNGSIKTEVRAGKGKIFSPLISYNSADLVLSLEAQEAVNAINFSSEKTMFIVNDFYVPTLGNDMPKEKILGLLKNKSKKVIFVPGTKLVKEKIGSDVVLGMFILSYAAILGLLPFSEADLKKAIKTILPSKFIPLNLKAFELAKTELK